MNCFDYDDIDPSDYMIEEELTEEEFRKKQEESVSTMSLYNLSWSDFL